METTAILSCTCSSGYQDRLYGKNMRVHNRCGSGKQSADKKSTPAWRCTVCEAKKGG